MVLTFKWMFNVDADFVKKTKGVKFESVQWKHPIEAITKITLNKNENRITLGISFDHDLQNGILFKDTGKKIKKFERKLEFNDDVTAREFLYQLIRL